MKSFTKITFVLSLSLSLLRPLGAQTRIFEFIRAQTVQTGLQIKTWGLDKKSGLDRYTQVALPTTYSLSVNQRLGIEVITAPYLSRVSHVGSGSASLASITDTFVRGSYILGDNFALVTAGAGLPSGKANLSKEDHLKMAGLAAIHPLDSPVTNFGSGFNLVLGIAFAQPFDEWVFGAGLGLALKGGYKTSVDSSDQDYNPGNEFNIALGVEREFEGSKGTQKFAADLIYTNYSTDELEGKPFYEAGSKFLLSVQYIMPISIFNPLIISISDRIRFDNDNKTGNAAQVENGNEFELKATAFHPRNEKLSLKYLLELKLFGNGSNNAGGASIFGLGGGAIYKLTDRITMSPTLMFFLGSINSFGGQSIGLTGFELNGQLSITL